MKLRPPEAASCHILMSLFCLFGLSLTVSHYEFHPLNCIGSTCSPCVFNFLVPSISALGLSVVFACGSSLRRALTVCLATFPPTNWFPVSLIDVFSETFCCFAYICSVSVSVFGSLPWVLGIQGENKLS
uniref:Uncharacterized protein n=1 Tax=Anguilla anguilla TaxID=7936 RepID=A0A0E9WT95_ANGAN